MAVVNFAASELAETVTFRTDDAVLPDASTQVYWTL
jgi:hypothetical protein